MNSAGRKWVVMAGKKQEIRIVVHMPKQVASVFSREQAEEFWIEKISGKIRESGLTKQQRKQLLDKASAFIMASWREF